MSRNVSAVEGTRFEVPFDSTGWTYLGEKNMKEGIAYDSRRFAGNSLIFVFNPTKTGDFVLRFQRQDSLRGISYEDLIGVTVTPKPAASPAPGTTATPVPAVASAGATVASGTAVATPVTAAIPGTAAGAAAPASAANVVAPASPVATSIPAGATTTPAGGATGLQPRAAPPPAIPVSSLTTPEAALAQARSALAAGQAQATLDALDRSMALVPPSDGSASAAGSVLGATDEALLLYGKALELNGPTKNIKRAYEYYKKLRDEYPESAFWDQADARVSYIERHYFDIR